MQELHTNMLIGTEIIYEYLKDVLGENRTNANTFYIECKKSITELIRNTLFKSLNYLPVYACVFDDIVPMLQIKDCRYGESFLQARNYENSSSWARYFKNERGISFNSKIKPNEKFWLLRLERDCAGLLLNFGNEDILLLSQSAICNQMREYIKEYEKEWNIRYYPSDYTDEKITGALADLHRIFVHKRNDGTFDRVFNYPLTEDIECRKDEFEINYFDDIKMVKVNIIQGEKNITDKLENLKMEDVSRWCDIREILADRNINYNYGEFTEKINNAIEKINKFLDLK